jgi:hypothetical protein
MGLIYKQYNQDARYMKVTEPYTLGNFHGPR